MLVLLMCLVLTGCKSTKKYYATFSKVSKFNYIEDSEEYGAVIHEGDVLIFSDLIEENGEWYARFSYKDTPDVKVLLGKKISDTEYEFATLEYK